MADVMKNVMNYLKCYQFDSCSNYLKTKQPVFSEKNAVNLLLCCYKGIDKNKMPMAYVFDYLKYCNFDDIQADTIDTFFQCLYHVLSQLISKGFLDELRSFKHILIPKCINNDLNEMQRKYYKSSIHLIIQYISKELESKKNLYPEVFVDLSNLALEMKFANNMGNNNCLANELENHVKYLLIAKFPYKVIIDMFMKYIPSISDGFVRYKSTLSLMLLLTRTCKSAKDKQKISSACFPIIRECANDSSMLLVQLSTNIFINLSNDLELDLRTVNNMLKSCDKRDKFVDQACLYMASLSSCTIQMEPDIQNIWKSKVTKETVVQYSKFAKEMECMLSNVKHQCCCGLNYKAQDAIFILSGIAIGKKFVEDSVVANAILDNLSYFSKHMSRLKDNKCSKFKSIWQKCGREYYNIAINMYKCQSGECPSYFMSLFGKFAAIEGIAEGGIIKNGAQNILELYIDFCCKKENYAAAFDIAALVVYLFRSEKSLTNFVICKKKLEATHRNKYIVSALVENEKLYRGFYKGFEKIEKVDEKIDLLLLEMNFYLKVWPSRKALISVLKPLSGLTEAARFAHILTDLPLEYLVCEDHEFYSIVCGCLESIKLEPKCDYALFFLYFFKFRYENIVLVYNSEKEIERVNDVKPLEVHPAEEVLHVNDTCDVVTSYNTLKVDNYSKVIEHLHKSLDHLKRAVETEGDLKEGFVAVSKNLGHTFNLHGLRIEALECWQLASRLAMRLNLRQAYVEIASMMLSYLNTSSEFFRKIVKNVEDFKNDMSIDAACFYYTNLAFAYLNNGDQQQCLKAYENASENYYAMADKLEQRDKELPVIKHFYNFLEAHIYSFPCDYNIYKHDNYVHIKPLTTFKLMHSDLKMISYNMEITPQFLALLFDISEYIVSDFNRLRFPRDARCYGREVLQLAQRMVVPFRTARLLILLAKADLLTSRYNDCKVKLSGVSDILALKKVKTDNPAIVVSNFCGMPEKPANPASPVLYKESFLQLDFLTHEDCDCIQCCCTEYQELLLKNVHLECMLNECTGNILISKNYFMKMDEIKEKVRKVRLSKLTYLDFELNEQVQSLQDTMDFIAVDNIKWSMRNNTKISLKEQLDVPESANPHINSEIFSLQNAVIIDWDSYFNKLNMVKSIPPINSNIVGARTPENKMTKIKFPRSISPKRSVDEPLVNKSIKKTLFNFDDFSVPKTPSTKFQIYTPTVKESKKNVKSEAKSAAKVKLLTEKLKSSLKVNDAEGETTSTRPKRTVRKNLMDEMSSTPIPKPPISNGRECSKRRIAKRDR